jgi:hypothetical protein
MEFSPRRPHPSSTSPIDDVAPIVGMPDIPVGDQIDERHLTSGRPNRATPTLINNVAPIVADAPVGDHIDARYSNFTYVAGSQQNFTTFNGNPDFDAGMF